MIRSALIVAALTAVLPSAPSFAVTSTQKMETCKFGADNQQLAGKDRAKFMQKCMSNKNDPRGNVPLGTAGPSAGPPPKN